MAKGGGLPTVGPTHLQGDHPMHNPLIALAGAPRILAWVNLMAISTSIALCHDCRGVGRTAH